MSLRRAAVAGTWYPNDPARLSAAVSEYIDAANVDDFPPARPRALVTPHAGLVYSGPVAAFAYKVARSGPYRAAILVGPSHFVPFRGVSIWEKGSWETPLGNVVVDEQLAANVQRQWDGIIALPSAHGREHSLEMQLPFIAHLLPGVPIVPLVMGYQTRETAFALGDAIARVSAGSERDDVLIVASSDLSHYEDARTAFALDQVVVQHVDAIDADGLMQALEREPRHACGGGPMVAVLHAARQLGATSARVLRYADSGDVSGDKSSVVGYMAAAVW